MLNFNKDICFSFIVDDNFIYDDSNSDSHFLGFYDIYWFLGTHSS